MVTFCLPYTIVFFPPSEKSWHRPQFVRCSHTAAIFIIKVVFHIAAVLRLILGCVVGFSCLTTIRKLPSAYPVIVFFNEKVLVRGIVRHAQLEKFVSIFMSL